MATVATVDNRLAAHRRLVEAFADELEERDPDGRVLGGNADRAEILVRSVTARLFNAAVWEDDLGPVYDAEGVAQILGGETPVSRQAVSKRRLLALRTGSGRVVYPAFQFDESGSVVDGVADVLKLIEPTQLSPWTLASWFVSPDLDLDGTQPIAALRAGGKEAVLEVVRRWAGALR